jgi:hypothetical protein
MNTVWKYNIPAQDEFTLDIPSPFTPLCVQTKNGKAWLWVRIFNTNKPTAPATFFVVGAGTPTPKQEGKEVRYIGSFRHSVFVWHLFESVSLF